METERQASTARTFQFSAFWLEYSPKPKIEGVNHHLMLEQPARPIQIKCTCQIQSQKAQRYSVDLIEVWGTPRDLTNTEARHMVRWVCSQLPHIFSMEVANARHPGDLLWVHQEQE